MSTGGPWCLTTPTTGHVSEHNEAKRFKPNSVIDTPTFLVHAKSVECLCCNKYIPYKELRHHATQGPHSALLVDFEPKPGALTVDEAEEQVEPRTAEGRKARRKRYRRENRARRGEEVAPAPSPSPISSEPVPWAERSRAERDRAQP